MPDEVIKRYIFARTLPNAFDIERARRMLLERIHTLSQAQSNTEPIDSFTFTGFVGQQHREFANPTGIEPGYERLEEEFTTVRAELAAMEAFALLQAHGVLVPFGLPIAGGNTGNVAGKIMVPRDRSIMHPNFGSYEVPSPTIYLSYRLASQFREDQFYRLASGSVYLSYLDQGKLPPRTERCIQECINAYRHGLYLSAVMAIGAASESLWMKLARSLVKKGPGVTTRVNNEISRHTPSIYQVIEEAWQVLRTQLQFQPVLPQVFSPGEQTPFHDRAKGLCERRNYAMHSDNADTEEASFTYTETGMLLLDSISYFNQLINLIEAVEALP